MVSVALAALPAYGHLYPVMPLAEALHAAGADVHVAVGEPFLSRLSLPTRPGIEPADGALSAVEREVMTEFPDVREDPGTRWPVTFFGAMNPRHVAPALRRAWRDDRPDLVVHEVSNVAAAIVAGELGIPSVALGISQYSPIWLSILQVAREVLAPGGLAPGRVPWDVAAAASQEPPPGWRYLDVVPAALQAVPRKEIPGWAPLRAVAWNEPAAAGEAPIPPPDGRPRVFVTLGTVAFGATDVLRAAVLAAAGTGAQVVVACGPEGDPAALGEMPEHVVLRRYLPSADLMPTVDLVVHHGGTGTMLAAAQHGIPQIVLPQGADQFLNAAQVARAGLGRAFVGEARTREAVAAAVQECLGDGRIRTAAQEVQQDIARMPSPESVAQDLLVGQ